LDTFDAIQGQRLYIDIDEYFCVRLPLIDVVQYAFGYITLFDI